MKKYLVGLVAPMLALGLAPSAQAVVTQTVIAGTYPSATQKAYFYVTEGQPQAPVSDTVVASFGNSFSVADTFDTTFAFIIDAIGIGSGGVSFNFSSLASELEFLSVTVKSGTFLQTYLPSGNTNSAGSQAGFINNTFNSDGTKNGQAFNASGIPIAADNLSDPSYIRVVARKITANGAGAYNGSLTYNRLTTAIPEASTWAMMILGMGAVGFAMRRRRSTVNSLRVAYA
ncbi:PEPxxWA-CTERM sorting domain-containing protein [Sphingobium sp. BS19]|uniref:PEPxxWA-CTERM sorting domain-containing protein n=1 Tax=Sphingobium sp. BS19 TaxID=3018973 RepID=UPI0022EE36D4|nr:PEPxxWA-CTERM sorting domain-containing protein [Sphingobium sp. BS19]GLJ00174.1 hypothetical protein Sbs19_39910 [Sphingobium sp. BS19]